MYIVDFQLVRYASPTLDLAYVMYLCLTREQREEHLPSLLEYYSDQLHSRLLEMSDGNSEFNNLSRDALHSMFVLQIVFNLTLLFLSPIAQMINSCCYVDRLQSEFKRSSRFGLGIALDMYPIMTCNSTEAPNLYQAKVSTASYCQVGSFYFVLLCIYLGNLMILQESGLAPSHDNVKPVWTSNAVCRKKMSDLVQELVDGGLL